MHGDLAISSQLFKVEDRFLHPLDSFILFYFITHFFLIQKFVLNHFHLRLVKMEMAGRTVVNW